MVRRHPGEAGRAYVARLRAVIAAGSRRPAGVPTPEEEIRRALAIVELGAPFGYLAGHRLDDFRRIKGIARDLGDARRLGVPDLGDRTAEAVRAAWSLAEPWRGRWE